MNDNRLKATPGGNIYDNKFLTKSYQAKIKEEKDNLELGKTLSGGRKFSIGLSHALEGTKMFFSRIAYKLKHGEYINNEQQLNELDASIDQLKEKLKETDSPHITTEKSKAMQKDIQKVQKALFYLEKVTGTDANKVGKTRTQLLTLQHSLNGLDEAESLRQKQVRAEKPDHQAINTSTKQILSQARVNLKQIGQLRDNPKTLSLTQGQGASLSIALYDSEENLGRIIGELEEAQKDLDNGILGSAEKLLKNINKYHTTLELGTTADSSLEKFLRGAAPETRASLLNQIQGKDFAAEKLNFETVRRSFTTVVESDKALLEVVQTGEQSLNEKIEDYNNNETSQIQRSLDYAIKSSDWKSSDYLAAYRIQCAIVDTVKREPLPTTFTEETAKFFIADRTELSDRLGLTVSHFGFLDQAETITEESSTREPERRPESLSIIKGTSGTDIQLAGQARKKFIEGIQLKRRTFKAEITTERDKYQRQLELTKKWMQEIKDPAIQTSLKQKRDLLKNIISVLDKKNIDIEKLLTPSHSQTLTGIMVKISPYPASNEELRTWEISINQLVSTGSLTTQQIESLQTWDSEIRRSDTIKIYLAITEYEQLAAKHGVNVKGMKPFDERRGDRRTFLEAAESYKRSIDEAMKSVDLESSLDKEIKARIQTDLSLSLASLFRSVNDVKWIKQGVDPR